MPSSASASCRSFRRRLSTIHFMIASKCMISNDRWWSLACSASHPSTTSSTYSLRCPLKIKMPRGVPEVDRGGHQQVPLDRGLRCAVVCSPSSAEVGVIWSFLYLAVRRVLELILLCFRSAEANEIEILVLRQELAVLRRRAPVELRPVRLTRAAVVVRSQRLRRDPAGAL